MFNKIFIPNLLMNHQCKNFESLLAFGEVMDKSLVSWFF